MQAILSNQLQYNQIAYLCYSYISQKSEAYLAIGTTIVICGLLLLTFYKLLKAIRYQLLNKYDYLLYFLLVLWGMLNIAKSIFAIIIFWQMEQKQTFDDDTFFWLSFKEKQVFIITAICILSSQTCFYLVLHNIFYMLKAAYIKISQKKYLDEKAYNRYIKIMNILIKIFILYSLFRFFAYFGYLLPILSSQDAKQERHIAITIMMNSAIQMGLLFIVYGATYYLLIKHSYDLKEQFIPRDNHKITKSVVYLLFIMVIKMIFDGQQFTDPSWKTISNKNQCDINRGDLKGMSLFFFISYNIFGTLIPYLFMIYFLHNMELKTITNQEHAQNKDNDESLSNNLLQ